MSQLCFQLSGTRWRCSNIDGTILGARVHAHAMQTMNECRKNIIPFIDHSNSLYAYVYVQIVNDDSWDDDDDDDDNGRSKVGSICLCLCV